MGIFGCVIRVTFNNLTVLIGYWLSPRSLRNSLNSCLGLNFINYLLPESSAFIHANTRGPQLILNRVDHTRNLCWNHRDFGIRIVNFNIILVILRILYMPLCIFSGFGCRNHWKLIQESWNQAKIPKDFESHW